MLIKKKEKKKKKNPYRQKKQINRKIKSNILLKTRFHYLLINTIIKHFKKKKFSQIKKRIWQLKNVRLKKKF